VCALKHSNVRRRYPKAETEQSRLALRSAAQFHTAVGKPLILRQCVEGEQSYTYWKTNKTGRTVADVGEFPCLNDRGLLPKP